MQLGMSVGGVWNDISFPAEGKVQGEPTSLVNSQNVTNPKHSVIFSVIICKHVREFKVATFSS